MSPMTRRQLFGAGGEHGSPPPLGENVTSNARIFRTDDLKVSVGAPMMPWWFAELLWRIAGSRQRRIGSLTSDFSSLPIFHRHNSFLRSRSGLMPSHEPWKIFPASSVFV